mmetsp:Transcript_2886/g.2712  ORF Transcript_2886/g.2712 Transcript_2886/m.2712 type:complete len:122 (+) Transcript_2886:1310-1675(+)|eukprot:CAMPEP_0170561556 /NCGR_PEP_ID=MMETSP0211-20121228/55440_1 /TAXON_ID=311385 /ORGANISM="Pseudokeronopsis sp., Strain OXSARD2" /LENGTH=121 /DNA_ID=CAMNT_0010877241 /DNA_START=1230 /DNA_END=1595 /DNA_ORIENTATION=+
MKQKELTEANTYLKNQYKEYKRTSEFYQRKYNDIDISALHAKKQQLDTQNEYLKQVNGNLLAKMEKVKSKTLGFIKYNVQSETSLGICEDYARMFMEEIGEIEEVGSMEDDNIESKLFEKE